MKTVMLDECRVMAEKLSSDQSRFEIVIKCRWVDAHLGVFEPLEVGIDDKMVFSSSILGICPNLRSTEPYLPSPVPHESTEDQL